MADSKGIATRDEKAGNLLFNYSMILMASFEAAFANLASTMTDAIAKTGVAMADAMSSAFGEGEQGAENMTNVSDVGPRTSEKLQGAFADLRNQARADFDSKGDEMKTILDDPAMDEGITIVEGYEFSIPKLTQKLSDEDLSSYMALMSNEDPKFMEMLKKLAVWQEKIPRPTPEGK